MNYILLALSLFALIGAPLVAQMTPKPVSQTNAQQGIFVQILIEKDDQGHDVPYLIDAKGNKIPLTMGSFVDAIANASLASAPTPASAMNPKAIAMISVEKDAQGVVKTYLVDNSGRREPLSLGNLVAEAAVIYPGCSADQINGQTVNITLTFAKDDNGFVQAYLVTPTGKEVFNLGVLLRTSTLLLNNCQPQTAPAK